MHYVTDAIGVVFWGLLRATLMVFGGTLLVLALAFLVMTIPILLTGIRQGWRAAAKQFEMGTPRKASVKDHLAAAREEEVKVLGVDEAFARQPDRIREHRQANPPSSVKVTLLDHELTDEPPVATDREGGAPKACTDGCGCTNGPAVVAGGSQVLSTKAGGCCSQAMPANGYTREPHHPPRASGWGSVTHHVVSAEPDGSKPLAVLAVTHSPKAVVIEPVDVETFAQWLYETRDDQLSSNLGWADISTYHRIVHRRRARMVLERLGIPTRSACAGRS